MPISGDSKRRSTTVRWLSFAVATLNIYLLGFAGILQAGGQTTTTRSRVITITSDPPGATIWKKEGRDYTCTNTLTPGTVELIFHGDSDVQRLRLRRFGYAGKTLDVKATDEKVGAALGAPDSKLFLIADGAPPDLKQMNASLKKEFEETLLADQDAFRCVPFELDFIHLDKDKETEVVELNVAIKLDRSFGGPAFRLASHAGNAQERRQRMAQAALDGGIADILARFRPVAVKFSELKDIVVLCFYSTTEARLETESTLEIGFDYKPVLQKQIDGHWEWVTEVRPVQERKERTVVVDRAAVKTLTFDMPVAQIPDTLDKKVISDAVLAAGEIKLVGNTDE